MNISELYRQVNANSVEKYEEPVTDVEFITALTKLALKELIIIDGSEVYVNGIER